MKQIIDFGEYSNSEIKGFIEDAQEVLRTRDEYRKAELVRQMNEAAAALKREFPNARYWEDAWDEDGDHCLGFDMMEYFPMDSLHLN